MGLLDRLQSTAMQPMNAYRRSAMGALKAYNAQQFDALGKAQGEELAGTPGFLAAQSMAGPGALARLRAGNLRRGVSRLASGLYEGAADAARGERDFTGEILKMREQKRLAQAKGGGLGGVLKRLGGAAVGFATGGPAGAATALLGDSFGLPGKTATLPGYQDAVDAGITLPGYDKLKRIPY